ncbi:hypothetical protein K7X08_026469 [Anisodus acutangulus]|uniref:laccase n=1 Tax=Anisodus acutangulus TaxID=402998 RepID=A0A9Q1LPH6_9SOLA|nr:hypothetical protein K7X08_026469 [Anisodus acutangulus]
MLRVIHHNGEVADQQDTMISRCKLLALLSYVTADIPTINGMYPGPVVYAQEDDKVIVRVTNESPYNITIHCSQNFIRQRLSCWSDGPSYITQCPIQTGQNITYVFSLVQQKGTFFWHAHVSWLQATVYGAIVVYPKKGVSYPFKFPYEEHIIILASGGSPPPADAFTINGQPGPNYNCSANDIYKIDVVPGKTYLLRLINAALNQEHFFAIANHRLTIVEVDAEYTKPLTTDRVMLGPGQTLNILVTADKPIARYSMAIGPYQSAKNVSFQNITSIAYFQYFGATANDLSLPAALPHFDDNLAAKTVMDGLRSLNPVTVPKEIDRNLFVTIGLNVQKCWSKNPPKDCQAKGGGVMAASMNNISFIKPNTSILEA